MSIESDNLLRKLSEVDTLLNSLMTDFKNIYEILGQNLVFAENSNDYSLINSIIRMQVRSTVSILESACFSIRHLAQELCKLKKILIPSKYSDLFVENIKFELKNKIKNSLRFLGFATTGVENIDVRSIEWQAVCDLLETRHRLTHPKNISDLMTTEKDLENVNKTMFWFSKQLFLILKKEDMPSSLEISKDDINKLADQYRAKYKKPS